MAAIAEIEVLPLSTAVDRSGDLDGSNDTVVVCITDEDGLTGIGECDAPPGVIKAFIEMPSAHQWSQSPRRNLLGADPVETVALWEKLYEATAYPGRRGLGIHAISAIDIALHDLAGKQLGLPIYKLLGGARRQSLTPYATIFPSLPQGRTINQVMEEIGQLFVRALDLGFRAVKMEVLFEDLVSDQELVALIREGRAMLGEDIIMALDFGYRWRDWNDARWVLDRIVDCNIYFAEATLQHDDLHGHARLAQHSPIRICGAEHAATRWEIREWIEVGQVAVVQPDINRCGGFTEIRRIAEMAELYGVQVIPHGWKTGITAACGRHFQAACPAAPIFEHLSPELFDSPLRRELVSPEPMIKAGRMVLPDAPGLGVELNSVAVEKYLIRD